jgi:hypothetical protein
VYRVARILPGGPYTGNLSNLEHGARAYALPWMANRETQMREPFREIHMRRSARYTCGGFTLYLD